MLKVKGIFYKIFLLSSLFSNFCFGSAFYSGKIMTEITTIDNCAVKIDLFNLSTFPRDSIVMLPDFPIGILGDTNLLWGGNNVQYMATFFETIKNELKGDYSNTFDEEQYLKVVTVEGFPLSLVCLKPTSFKTEDIDWLKRLLVNAKIEHDKRKEEAVT